MNRPMRWILALALLLVPTTAAEPAPALQRETLEQRESGVRVVEQLDWSITNNSTYDASARFYAPAAITARSVTLVQGSLVRTVPDSAVQKQPSAATNFDLYRVDLRSLQAEVAAGAEYSLVIEYQATGTAVQLRTAYAVPSLVLFAVPRDGHGVTSAAFTDFLPAGRGSVYAVHAVRADMPANMTYDAAFVELPLPASSRDFSPYVWSGGGLLVGLLVMLVAIRRGWVAAPGRAKKFAKGGQMESRGMLEARRRTLLAALKDLEQAHEAKEVPDDAYAPLKEEYKAQAVRVMRTLEEKRE